MDCLQAPVRKTITCLNFRGMNVITLLGHEYEQAGNGPSRRHI